MIGFIAVCLLATQSLTASGTNDGLWFVGDRPPDAIGHEHELCERQESDKYWVVRPMIRRPAAMVVDSNTMWFVDIGSGVELYKVALSGNGSSNASGATGHGKTRMIAFLQKNQQPTDLIVEDEQPIIAFGGSTLELYKYTGLGFEQLAILDKSGAQVAKLNSRLIAAAPEVGGVTMWHLNGESWKGGDFIEFEGHLVDLLVHDDWPILIVEDAATVNVIGLQHGGPIEIASLDVPRGRWGVFSSPHGLSAVGVERIGKTTVVDIGWPSGVVSRQIVLQEEVRSSGTFLTTLTFIIPLVLLILFVTISRRQSQPPNNNARNPD